jgi:ABC-type glycerol-3-phosphate transport system permease component
MMRQMNRHTALINIGKTAIYLILAAVALTTLFPFYWAVGTSLKTEQQAIAIPPKFFPNPLKLSNYPYALGLFPFGRFYLNTVIFACAGTVGSIVLSALAGYALAKYRFRGQYAILIFIVATMMVPYWVNLVPVYIILAKLGWLDSYHGLIIPRLSRPFGIFLMRQYMYNIPSDYIDAARIDGTSEFRILRQVVLPQCIPVLATLTIFFFVDDWNSFLWPLLVTNSEQMRTVTVGLALLSGSPYRTAYALQMSAAVIGALPAIVVFLVFQRYITQGITLSGLKG